MLALRPIALSALGAAGLLLASTPALAQDYSLPEGSCFDGTAYYPEGGLFCEEDVILLPLDAEPLWYGRGNGTCEAVNDVVPCKGEERHWIAGRFEAPATPFVVTHVRYTLFHGDRFGVTQTCTAGLVHTVELYKGSTLTPDANPEPLASLPVKLYSPATGNNVITLPITSTPVIEEGEYLFLAIQYNGDLSGPDGTCDPEGESLCVASCPSESVEHITAGFWSNAESPDYDWSDLTSFGIEELPDFAVQGYSP